jgi:hypothetical protein
VALRVFRRLRLPEFLGDWHTKVVRLSALRTGRLYSQDIPLLLISVRGSVDSRAIVLPEVLSQWKIPVTLLGIEPAAFRLVELCLADCTTACRSREVTIRFTYIVTVFAL